MLPLCNALDITVNDLLSGERIAQADYPKKADQAMLDLLQKNAENRERAVLAAICGGIAILAVLSLVLLASFMNLPVFMRIAILLLAVLTAAVGIGAAIRLDARAGCYECPHCKTLFAPTISEYVKAYHTFTKRRLTCPHCGQTGMCRRKVTR